MLNQFDDWITDKMPVPFEKVTVKTSWGEEATGHWRDYGAWSCWEVDGHVSNGVNAWKPLLTGGEIANA